MLKAEDNNSTQPPKPLLTHATHEPGICTAILERISTGKMEEMGAADGVIHKKDCFFNIQVSVIQGAF